MRFVVSEVPLHMDVRARRTVGSKRKLILEGLSVGSVEGDLGLGFGRASVCVCERERVWGRVCERESECERVCVRERERVRARRAVERKRRLNAGRKTRACRGTPFIRNTLLLGPYSRTI